MASEKSYVYYRCADTNKKKFKGKTLIFRIASSEDFSFQKKKSWEVFRVERFSKKCEKRKQIWSLHTTRWEFLFRNQNVLNYKLDLVERLWKLESYQSKFVEAVSKK